MKATLILLPLLAMMCWVSCRRAEVTPTATQSSVASQQGTPTRQMPTTWQTNDPPLASQVQFLVQMWAPLELTPKEFASLLDLWCKDQAIISDYLKNLNGDWLRKEVEPIQASIKALLGSERYRIYGLTKITGYSELYAIVKEHKLPLETMEKFVALREETALELSNLKPGIERINGRAPICRKMRRQVREMLGQSAYAEFKVLLSMTIDNGWDGPLDD